MTHLNELSTKSVKDQLFRFDFYNPMDFLKDYGAAKTNAEKSEVLKKMGMTAAKIGIPAAGIGVIIWKRKPIIAWLGKLFNKQNNNAGPKKLPGVSK